MAKEVEKEAEKENPTIPGEASDVGKGKESGVEEEEEDSTDSSDDTSEKEAEKENPAIPVPQTSATKIDQVATPEESLEERRERLCRELDEGFRRKMKDLTSKVENGLAFSATRTVTALFHGSVSALHTPSDLVAEDVKEFQTLGELNRETLTTLDKTRRRSEQFRLLLKAKKSHLIGLKTQQEKELSKKINWVQRKLAEEDAEKGAIEKMLKFLAETQRLPEAKEVEWSGLQFDLTREGCDQLANLSLYEAIFSERMGLTDRNPVQDLELALKELESAPTIDLEHEGSIAPPREEGSMAPPKDPVVPKPKKTPGGMTPATKAMPRLPDEKKEKEAVQDQEKKKREEDAAATAEVERGGKKARYEYYDTSTAALIKSKYVPKEHLYINVPQEVWETLGAWSRERILSERETTDRCFFCNKVGHRAFACRKMVALAAKWGAVTGQCKTGGQERKKSLWCSSCAFQNSLAAIAQGGSTRFATGWFQHIRSTCRQREQCPLFSDEDLWKMSSAEMRDHLRELGVMGQDEQAKRKAEIQAASRASEVRSVSISEDPEKKRLKKEKKQEEKRKRAEAEAIRKAEEDRLKKEKEEEDRLRKEAEESKESLRASANYVLHSYLFDSSYRCAPRKMEKHAKYAKKLPHEVLAKTPNYISRLAEANEHNRRQLEEYKARMLRKEKERILKEEEEKEEERLKKKAERKAAKAAKKEEKKEKKKVCKE